MTDEITQYDNPNDIDILSTLKIQAVSGNLSPSIYANGRNQLPIEITAKAVNKDGNPLKFSNETWISILNLCFAESDKKLSSKGNSGWCFTEVENEYSVELQPGSHRSKRLTTGEDGTAIIILYVYTDGINTKRIAVSVDTDNGKHFTTADIPSGAEKMYLTIISHPKINYSNRNNIRITEGSFEDINNSVPWASRFGKPIFKEHHDGTCKRKFVEIHPAMGGQFKKHKIIYTTVTNYDVSNSYFVWAEHTFVPDENVSCFNIIQGPHYPCAVIGRGENFNDYQINLWYNAKNQINIGGSVMLESTSYLLYKFTMPSANCSPLFWHNLIYHPEVRVTDFYGNEGTITLTFNDTDHFDIPGIV
ncbi:hypothetical protein E3U36_04565 [Arsenophonus endosymbiont of Aphis craccivora]|uniref:hypothetical protein n=1 Tax=Arsenophonus endosymbiont of Aphis craccivora TaxID=1231049 RepID=UPI0015DD1A2C|nr:hypothetical protein [Arsenophonus endosymbiont of Aphis craccivora]QLK87601.1 hypothetical protein E3U36_04565 [Arsenophonus endosymbiont of Aphis craccivora]